VAVGGDAEAGNRERVGADLGDFFDEGHLGDEGVDAGFYGERWVAPRRGCASAGGAGADANEECGSGGGEEEREGCARASGGGHGGGRVVAGGVSEGRSDARAAKSLCTWLKRGNFEKRKI